MEEEGGDREKGGTKKDGEKEEKEKCHDEEFLHHMHERGGQEEGVQ